MDVIMFIPNTLPILLHKNLGRGTQLKLSIPTLIYVKCSRAVCTNGVVMSMVAVLLQW